MSGMRRHAGDQRRQMDMNFKLALNHLLNSKQRNSGFANMKQRKKILFDEK